MDDIAVKTRQLLTENMGVDIAIITDDATLAGDLDLDSVEMTEFALLLEEAFNVEILDDMLSASMTVGQVCEAIRKLKG